MPINPEKLKALQAQAASRTGGVRRKVAPVARAAPTEDKKVTTVIEKIGGRPIPQIEEVNMFLADGNVMNFPRPKVTGSVEANAWIVQGYHKVKPLQELLPGILTQLGGDSIAELQKMFAQLSASGAIKPDGMPDMAAFEGNFEDAANGDAPDLVDA